MTLLEARMRGRLAETIFSPPTIHPDLREMLNPGYFRQFVADAKRKRAEDDALYTSSKKTRIAEPTALDDEGFGDGGFGDVDTRFGEGFGDGFGDHVETPPRQRTISPLLTEDDAQPEEDEEAPTS